MLRKTKALIIINMILLVFLLGLNLRLNNANAQSNGDSLTIPINFSMLEFGEKNGTNENVGSIDIEIPSSPLNLTNIQLNFTDINLGREIKTIEDQPYDYGEIFKKNPASKRLGLGVQINLTEATIIYGVYIYGYKTSETTELIDVQLRGYDSLYNKPNSTIYRSVNFNISHISGWYLQNFSNPLSLSAGNYSLVLNGTNIVSAFTHYYWAYNDNDPMNPNLHSSEYISQWLDGVQNSPYLYKLIQKTEQSYNPEAINMTIEVDDNLYNITNDLPGNGKVEISNINLPLNQSNLIFPVYHNQSVELVFNVSYILELENDLASPGTLHISETHDNHWSVIPIINPDFSNYTVKFNFPQSWLDVNVLKNDINITGIVDINYTENDIFIPTNLISEGDLWEITARSSKIDFSLDVSRTEFLAGQELKFFISEPLLDGNYTFNLNDPYHDKIYTSSNISESNSFTYIIPSSAIDGDYKAYIYWFNGTDAGVTTQIFVITLPFAINWSLVVSVIIVVGLTSAISASSYMLIKKNRKKSAARKETIFNRCMDILNLNYLLIIEKKSSLNIYDQVFTDNKLNTSLISGFLEAIRTFGLDITGSEEHSQTIKLEYKNSKIIMSDFKNFRIIFIMKDIPSNQFFDSIEALSYEIEEKHGAHLKEFKGNLQPFKNMEELIKKHFGTSFLYPLKVVGTGKTRISATEKAMIGRAMDSMEKNKSKYCYTTQLMQEKGFSSKDVETIFSLIDKKVFQPII